MTERRRSRSGTADDGYPGGRQRARRDGPEAARGTREPRSAADELEPAAEYEGEQGGAIRTARQAVKAVLLQVMDLTGKQPENITDVERREDGWMIGIEVVEDRRIPSSADILASYEATVDQDGELIAYRRVSRYIRGRSDIDGRS
jgi:hypothetical protein